MVGITMVMVMVVMSTSERAQRQLLSMQLRPAAHSA